MDTLNDALDTAWRLLGRGAADRRSPVHTPVVASVGLGGAPDARSPKCAALDGRAVAVLAYHPGEAVQLRLAGTARIVREGPQVEQIWATSTPFARRCYLVEAPPGCALPAPGSALPAFVEGRAPEAAELVPARANFALVVVTVTAIDWLHLAQGGHRRAQFSAADGWAGGWVVP